MTPWFLLFLKLYAKLVFLK